MLKKGTETKEPKNDRTYKHKTTNRNKKKLGQPTKTENRKKTVITEYQGKRTEQENQNNREEKTTTSNQHDRAFQLSVDFVCSSV